MKKIILLVFTLFITLNSFSQVPAYWKNGIAIGSFASDPTGVRAGQIYWNSTDAKFRQFNGVVWADLVDVEPTLFYPVENTYLDNAEMFANQGEQTENYFQYVSSTDTYYQKLSASTGQLSDYRELSIDEVTVISGRNQKPVLDNYTDLATMYLASNQRKQIEGYLYRVDSNNSYYQFLGTRNGDATDYIQINVSDVFRKSDGITPANSYTEDIYHIGKINDAHFGQKSIASFYAGATAGNGTGNYNVSVGEEAHRVASGNNNVSVGYRARREQSGNSNVAIGEEAMRFGNGSSSVAIGALALSSGSSNSSNSLFIGANSGRFAVNANNSVALGRGSMEQARVGENVAVGWNSGSRYLKSNNTSLGYNSNTFNTNPDTSYTITDADVDVGNNSIIVTGHGLTIGQDYWLRYLGSDGTNPTGLVDNILYLIQPTSINVLEFQQITLTSTGSGNLSFISNYNVENSTAIGANSFNTKDNQVVLGDSNVTEVYTDGKIKSSAYGNGTVTGTSVFSIEVDADGNFLEGQIGVPYTGANQTIDLNGQDLLNVDVINGVNLGGKSPNVTYFGSGAHSASGGQSDAFGAQTLQNVSGGFNAAFGYQAGRNLIGGKNQLFGYRAGQTSNGSSNQYIGYQSGIRANGSDNTLIGDDTGSDIIGNDNVGIGENVLLRGFNVNNSTLVGSNAGSALEDDNNTAIGYGAFPYLGDPANDLTFPSSAVDTTLDTFTIPNHGIPVGETRLYVYIGSSDGVAGGIGNLTENIPFRWTAQDANTLTMEGQAIVTQGTGTHTIRPQIIVNNSTAVGANSKPTKSNQVVLGDENVIEVVTSGTYVSGGYTVATLPTGVTGARAYVTDSSLTASGNFGATVVGGGSNVVPVFFDGTNWIIA